MTSSGPTTARPLVIGTRGSPLAQAQTREVLAALGMRFPSLELSVRVVSTRGDQDQRTPLEDLGQGIFTREIERALLSGEIDLAVHSLKDMETELPPGLAVGAVPPRGDPRDALVSSGGRRLADLAPGARVGTGSPRRAALVRSLRPDLAVLPIRGNVGTRLDKLDQGQYDAVVLAAVGLARLGMESRVAEYLDPSSFTPAVGQAALGVEVRADDREVIGLVQALDHPSTRQAVTAERAFLRGLGGGCSVPVAAYGCVDGGVLRLAGLVASENGARSFRAVEESAPEAAEETGRRLAGALLRQGAGELLAAEASS